MFFETNLFYSFDSCSQLKKGPVNNGFEAQDWRVQLFEQRKCSHLKSVLPPPLTNFGWNSNWFKTGPAYIELAHRTFLFLRTCSQKVLAQRWKRKKDIVFLCFRWIKKNIINIINEFETILGRGGGYVPDKSPTASTKTTMLRLKYA